MLGVLERENGRLGLALTWREQQHTFWNWMVRLLMIHNSNIADFIWMCIRLFVINQMMQVIYSG